MAQKLPQVGHVDPAGAALTQTEPAPKPWQSASLVQVGEATMLPAQSGWPVRETTQVQGLPAPPWPQNWLNPASGLQESWPKQVQLGSHSMHCPPKHSESSSQHTPPQHWRSLGQQEVSPQQRWPSSAPPQHTPPQHRWSSAQQAPLQQGVRQQTSPQPDVSDPRQQVLPAQPLAGGSQTVAPHWVTRSAQEPSKQLPEQQSLSKLQSQPFTRAHRRSQHT